MQEFRQKRAQASTGECNFKSILTRIKFHKNASLSSYIIIVAMTFCVLLAAAVAYLGSPLWHYGRTLFGEPFLAFLGVAAYAAASSSSSSFAICSGK